MQLCLVFFILYFWDILTTGTKEMRISVIIFFMFALVRLGQVLFLTLAFAKLHGSPEILGYPGASHGDGDRQCKMQVGHPWYKERAQHEGKNSKRSGQRTEGNNSLPGKSVDFLEVS